MINFFSRNYKKKFFWDKITFQKADEEKKLINKNEYNRKQRMHYGGEGRKLVEMVKHVMAA